MKMLSIGRLDMKEMYGTSAQCIRLIPLHLRLFYSDAALSQWVGLAITVPGIVTASTATPELLPALMAFPKSGAFITYS